MGYKYKNIQLPSNKNFGYFFSIIFLFASGYFYFNGINFAFYYSGIASIAFFVIATFKEDILRPLNKLWMNFGLILGKIINPIIIGVIFFFIFTPIGIIMRLFGRDELQLRFKKKSSYWVKHNKNIQSNSFRKQF